MTWAELAPDRSDAGARVVLASLVMKPVWEAEFQIMLANEKQSSGDLNALLGQKAGLASLAGLGSGTLAGNGGAMGTEPGGRRFPRAQHVKRKRTALVTPMTSADHCSARGRAASRGHTLKVFRFETVVKLQHNLANFKLDQSSRPTPGT